jgi:serine/threonine protein kinase
LEIFGKFQLLERIGDGGMAEVFLAKRFDVALAKLLAIKRILPSKSDDPEFQEMFKREAAIALRFRRPSIIAVHEFGVIDGRSYMSMEFFPGNSLAKLFLKLRDSSFEISVVDKVLIIRSIADALHYIHNFTDYGVESKFIHRDISPHNIMIGFDGATKLLDFGIAKEMKEHSQTNFLKGKIAYMSPEQVNGRPLTNQTDVFSLGIVLWEFLAEKRLFAAKNLKEISEQVKACNIPSLNAIDADIPVEIDQICQRALARDPQLRYKSTGELIRDIDKFLQLTIERESHQKNVAWAMRVLFPEEAKALTEKLKKYEGDDYEESQSLKSLKTPLPTFKRKSAIPWERIIRVGGFVGAAVLTVMFVFSFLHKEKRELSHPMISPPKSVALALPPTAPPPQKTVPIPEPEREPEPAAAPPPPAFAKASEPVKTIVAKKNPKRPNKVVKKAPPPPAIVKVKRPILRKVASKPAGLPLAYLTVLADANSKILIDGKVAGTEVVNEIKVPAEKSILIKVISSETGETKTKEVTLKPYSRNVIEFNVEEGPVPESNP